MPKVNFMDHITNIEIFFNAEFWVDDTESASNIYSAAPAGPLKFFQEAGVSRNSLVLVIHFGELAVSYAANMSKSPLFESLRQMIGFKNVTLSFTNNWKVYCPSQGTGRTQVQKWIKIEKMKKPYEELEPLFSTMSRNLKPTLGKEVVTGTLIPGKPGGNLDNSGRCAILFHPRDHQAKLSKANKDTTNQKQSMDATGLGS